MPAPKKTPPSKQRVNAVNVLQPSDPDDAPPKPLSFKRTQFAIPTVDPSTKAVYAERFKKFGLFIECHASSLARLSYWRVMNAAKLERSTWSLTTGFDIDLDRALKQLEDGCAPERIDLCFHAAPSAVQGSARPSFYGAGKRCVMCGEPGGLPCPRMIEAGLAARIVFAIAPTHADFQPRHVHPGRCRARLYSVVSAFKAASQVEEG